MVTGVRRWRGVRWFVPIDPARHEGVALEHHPDALEHVLYSLSRRMLPSLVNLGVTPMEGKFGCSSIRFGTFERGTDADVVDLVDHVFDSCHAFKVRPHVTVRNVSGAHSDLEPSFVMRQQSLVCRWFCWF